MCGGGVLLSTLTPSSGYDSVPYIDAVTPPEYRQVINDNARLFIALWPDPVVREGLRA